MHEITKYFLFTVLCCTVPDFDEICQIGDRGLTGVTHPAEGRCYNLSPVALVTQGSCYLAEGARMHGSGFVYLPRERQIYDVDDAVSDFYV